MSRRGARLVVTTAAAEKVYRTLEPAATIDVKLAVGAGGSLAWLPQETILFDRARLRRSIDIDLADGAQLLLAEAIVFGRAGMGEAVEDCVLFDRWRLRRGGRSSMPRPCGSTARSPPSSRSPRSPRAASRSRPCWSCPAMKRPRQAVRALDAKFRGEVGVSAWNGFAIVRLCAADGAALRHDLVSVLTAVRGASLPRLWLN